MLGASIYILVGTRSSSANGPLGMILSTSANSVIGKLARDDNPLYVKPYSWLIADFIRGAFGNEFSMGIARLVKRGIANPLKLRKLVTEEVVRHNIGRELNKLYHSRGNKRSWNPRGIDIFSEDWDNLVILDALRYDAMRAAIDRRGLEWNITSRISRGSQTPEWLYANFAGRQLYDVVYVSASAMPQYLGVENGDSKRQQRYGFNLDVHELRNIWMDPPEQAVETFIERDEADMVLPAETMIEPALEAVEDHPDKRILIHITQPHDPYLGETGRSLYDDVDAPWQAKLTGDLNVPVSTLREAYRENVDMAVEAAAELVEKMPGKTVVSSDHGEHLLDRAGPIPTREFLHPDKVYTDELVKVPWVEFEGRRREITAEPPVAQADETKNRTTEEQLNALGYL